jgi:hypothetical protein
LLVLFVGFPYVVGPESPAAAAVTAMTCDESSKQARCKAEFKVAAGLILVHVFTKGPLSKTLTLGICGVLMGVMASTPNQ